jgi:hypothetical protein
MVRQKPAISARGTSQDIGEQVGNGSTTLRVLTPIYGLECRPSTQPTQERLLRDTPGRPDGSGENELRIGYEGIGRGSKPASPTTATASGMSTG